MRRVFEDSFFDVPLPILMLISNENAVVDLNE